MITKKKTQISGYVDFDVPHKIQIIQNERNAKLLREGKQRLRMDDLYNEAIIKFLKSEGL
jgi:hypothetical protein